VSQMSASVSVTCPDIISSRIKATEAEDPSMGMASRTNLLKRKHMDVECYFMQLPFSSTVFN
jgi:hypothetical protein